VAEDLPEYRWIGLGREGGSRGEFMAIFFKQARFEPIEFDHFWLSDTPNVIGSATWGNSVRRMVSWVKFHDQMAKRDLIFINTHFDHEVEEARQKSAELLAERTLLFGKRLSIILTGDFNSPAGEASVVYKKLVTPGPFVDAWDQALKGTSRTRSFNGFEFPAPVEGARIDWILLRGPILAKKILIDDFAVGKQYPSDHFPVIVTLEYAP
jgi:endonuclease/exonuclease/phosphatase family metal-dependent hydrolase